MASSMSILLIISLRFSDRPYLQLPLEAATEVRLLLISTFLVADTVVLDLRFSSVTYDVASTRKVTDE